MRKTTFLAFSMLILSTVALASTVTISGAAGINDGTTFTTLKNAFDAINSQPDQTGKNIEIKIGGNTTEIATAVLNQPTTASWNSLIIYPIVSSATIEGSFVGTIIDIDGADKVTINGKLNKTGAAKSLTISHTSNADNGNRTLRIWNDAKENVIQYCTIIGKCPSSGAGVIFLGDAKSTTGEGNDNNVIEYNDINAAGAANGIKASSANVFPSEGNTVRNNNIFDFYQGNVTTTVTSGIDFGANYTTSTITANSLYQTASRDYNPTTAVIHVGINVSGASNGNNITDNYIGGSAPQCGGVTAWTVTGGLYRLFALQTSFGTTTASSIQGNTIANLDITSGFITNGSSLFIGHQHAAGVVNVGTITGNTIGSIISNGSIKVKCNVANLAAGPLCVGMNIVAANAIYSNNKIGGIIYDLNENGNRGHLYAVSTSGAGPFTFTNNTVGSPTLAKSIEHKGSTYITGQVNLRGLSCGNAGVTTLTGNTIANISATSTATMAVNGIFHNGGGVNTISNNTIRDINSAGTRVITTQGVDAGLVGMVINCNSTGNVIGGNAIYNLENTNTTLATDIYGINFHSLNAGASTIEKNKIFNLKTASTNTASNVVGISITRGLTITSNNMISLGNGITNAVSIVGIRKLGTASTQNNSFYHNSVLITGSEVGIAGTSYSAAFAKVYTATDDVKNNIFINNRSNASGNTQKQYVVNLNDAITFISDNNVVNYSGNGGLAGIVSSTEYNTLPLWQSGSTLDVNSRIFAVNFTSANLGDLTITGTSLQNSNLKVPSLAEVTTDIMGTVRNTSFTYAGAHQSTLPFTSTGLDKTFMHAGILITKAGIEIRTTEKTIIEIFTLNGVQIEKTVSNSTYSRNLDNGIYILKLNGKAIKIVK